MKRLLTIVSMFCIIGCEPEIIEPYQTYLIPEGKHNSVSITSSLQSEVLSFATIFNQSAIYESKSEINQYDINKLLGFSDCNTFHHTNSARFGWRWLDGNLEIHGYTYVDGIRYSQFIGVVELDRSYEYQLHITDTEYLFYLEGSVPVAMERKANCSVGLYYMLYPYFGGNEVAPHDITIDILMHY